MTFTVTPSLPDKGVPYRFEAFRFGGFSCAAFWAYSMVRMLLKGKITHLTWPIIMSRVRAAGVK